MNHRLKHSEPPLPTKTVFESTIPIINLHLIRAMFMRAFYAVLLDAANKGDGRNRRDRLGVGLTLSDGFPLSFLEVAPEDEEFFAQFLQGALVTTETRIVSV